MLHKKKNRIFWNCAVKYPPIYEVECTWKIDSLGGVRDSSMILLCRIIISSSYRFACRFSRLGIINCVYIVISSFVHSWFSYLFPFVFLTLVNRAKLINLVLLAPLKRSNLYSFLSSSGGRITRKAWLSPYVRYVSIDLSPSSSVIHLTKERSTCTVSLRESRRLGL